MNISIIEKMNIRQKNWNNLKHKCFDVAIIGGGINGASVYKKLCQEGYKVFLVDKGDFSCGTSQASAMMIWGGLLYLRNFDLPSVYTLSKDRDILIDLCKNQIISKKFRYIPNSEWGRNKYLVYLALQFYWMLGKFKRERPKFEQEFAESNFIKSKGDSNSLIYEEGFLKQSDSRFVLEWILSHQSESSLSINYCSIQKATYQRKDKLWALDLKDKLSNAECEIKAKIIVNCAGVWTDKVNSQFGIKSPYKHVFSKGVFIGYERPEEHSIPLIFEMGKNGDTLTFIPWGPVSLWGPTETMEKSIENGYSINSDDISFLLEHASKNLDSSLSNSKIISLRCGLRPLAVPDTFKDDCYPLDISRHFKIIEDATLPWISIYGGKISGCLSMSENAVERIKKKVPHVFQQNKSIENGTSKMPRTFFPGLSGDFPTIDWCIQNEFCCSLEDYLRRRTNISQWSPREGLGFQNENKTHLKNLTQELPNLGNKTSGEHVDEYVNNVNKRFDCLMEQI